MANKQLTITVRRGTYGFHASVDQRAKVWATAKDGPKTAAWRAAMRFWFHHKVRQQPTYDQAHQVIVKVISNRHAIAQLTHRTTN